MPVLDMCIGAWEVCANQHEQGGSAIRRPRSAVLVSALFFLLSTGAAHADPHFALTESQARAGEAVHFSISGARGRVEYELEIGDREVLEGSGAGKHVLGQFTMPDLGPTGRTVTVEAEIEESDDRTSVERKLLYLAPAPAPTTTTVVATPPAAVLETPSAATPAAEPVHPLKADQAPIARPAETPIVRPAGKPPAKRSPSHARERRRSARHRSISGSGRNRDRVSRVKRRRAKRNAPRTAPLFDGIPESPGTPGSGGGGNGFLALNAIVPPPATLAASTI
ncbi:MAG: hypothetical protein ACRDLQ_06965, partial [Solirubrobacterales bacterium]